jgi:hypothetical protein
MVNSTDEILLNRIRNTHKLNQNFQMPKLSKENFTIIHTAKNVDYNIRNFRVIFIISICFCIFLKSQNICKFYNQYQYKIF